GSATTSGTYTVTVTAADGVTTTPMHSATFTVTVPPTATPVSVTAGASGTTTNATFLGPSGITVTNFSCVSITGTAVPTGITCQTFNPTSVTLAGPNSPSSPVTVTVATTPGSTTTTALPRGTKGIFEAMWL